MRYALLIHGNDEQWEQRSEDERKAIYAEYFAVSEAKGVYGGAELQPESTSTTVRVADIWSRRYSSANGWAEPMRVESNDQGDAADPRFAFDGAGNAVAVWTQPNGSYLSVWASRFTPAGGWSAATALQDHDSGNAMSPSIAVNADGETIAVWGQLDGSHANVWANRLR